MATILQQRKIPSGYVHLAPSMLRRLSSARIAVYFCGEDSDHPVLYRDAEVELDEQTLKRLIAEKGNNLYVRLCDFRDACNDLAASLGDLVSDETVSPADRFQVMQIAVRFEIERTLKAVDPGKFIELVANVSQHLNRLVTENELLPNELFAIARHDSQTFSHVTNVAAYSVMLAQQLGINDQNEQHEIAMGAMLHDLGKRSVPKHIITKPGRLSDEEKSLIRTHPLRGYEELHPRTDVTQVQRLMVYQHHEHVDGSGYPVRILKKEIHPWSRLLAVVDVFDALTGSRPYRQPMTISEACEFLSERAGKQFDQEMVKCWNSTIKNQ